MRTTFLFLLGEKKKRAAPGTKKKSAGSGLAGRKLLLFLLCPCPELGLLGAVRIGLSACAAAADGCGRGSDAAAHWLTARFSVRPVR